MEVKVLETTKEHYKVLVTIPKISPHDRSTKQGVTAGRVCAHMRDVLNYQDVTHASSDTFVHNTQGATEGEFIVCREMTKVVDTPKKVATVYKRATSKLKKSAAVNKEE